MEPEPTKTHPADWRPVATADCRRCPVHTRCILFRMLRRRGDPSLLPVRRAFRHKEVVFAAGDRSPCVMTVAAGRVQVRRSDPAGALLYVDWPPPGRPLDHRAFLSQTSHTASARAIDGAEICALPRKAVGRLASADRELALDLLDEAERELELIERAMRLRATRPLQSRVRLALHMFAESEGRRCGDGGWRVDLPIHRRDLAALVGARPETITRILHEIEEQGLARFEGRHVEIPSLERLARP